MFKKHTKQHIVRFKEFDEARKYIEDNHTDINMSMEAVDYIVNHKEYYYLLKKLYEKIEKNDLPLELAEYILSRLSGKLKREEDFELLYKILKTQNTKYIEPIKEFLRSNSCFLKNFLFKLLENSDANMRLIAVQSLKQCVQITVKNRLKKHFYKEKDKKVLNEIIKYFEIFGTDEEIKKLKNNLQEQIR